VLIPPKKWKKGKVVSPAIREELRKKRFGHAIEKKELIEKHSFLRPVHHRQKKSLITSPKRRKGGGESFLKKRTIEEYAKKTKGGKTLLPKRRRERVDLEGAEKGKVNAPMQKTTARLVTKGRGQRERRKRGEGTGERDSQKENWIQGGKQLPLSRRGVRRPGKKKDY